MSSQLTNAENFVKYRCGEIPEWRLIEFCQISPDGKWNENELLPTMPSTTSDTTFERISFIWASIFINKSFTSKTIRGDILSLRFFSTVETEPVNSLSFRRRNTKVLHVGGLNKFPNQITLLSEIVRKRRRRRRLCREWEAIFFCTLVLHRFSSGEMITRRGTWGSMHRCATAFLLR